MDHLQSKLRGLGLLEAAVQEKMMADGRTDVVIFLLEVRPEGLLTVQNVAQGGLLTGLVQDGKAVFNVTCKLCSMSGRNCEFSHRITS